MISIDKVYQNEYIINKSRFIAIAYPVWNEVECKEILNNLRREYSDATHICHAYIMDKPKVEKCSDDGEPSGTAGKPMLELLKKRKLSNILLVIIRYFGGIKLGAGGLVRAYTNSGNVVLDMVKIINVIEAKKYRICLDYSQVDKVKKLIISNNGTILKLQYSELAEMEFLLDNIDILSDYKIKEIGSEKICL